MRTPVPLHRACSWRTSVRVSARQCEVRPVHMVAVIAAMDRSRPLPRRCRLASRPAATLVRRCASPMLRVSVVGVVRGIALLLLILFLSLLGLYRLLSVSRSSVKQRTPTRYRLGSARPPTRRTPLPGSAAPRPRRRQGYTARRP